MWHEQNRLFINEIQVSLLPHNDRVFIETICELLLFFLMTKYQYHCQFIITSSSCKICFKLYPNFLDSSNFINDCNSWKLCRMLRGFVNVCWITFVIDACALHLYRDWVVTNEQKETYFINICGHAKCSTQQKNIAICKKTSSGTTENYGLGITGSLPTVKLNGGSGFLVNYTGDEKASCKGKLQTQITFHCDKILVRLHASRGWFTVCGGLSTAPSIGNRRCRSGANFLMKY